MHLASKSGALKSQELAHIYLFSALSTPMNINESFAISIEAETSFVLLFLLHETEDRL